MSKVDGVTCQRVKTNPGSWANVYLFVGGNAIITPSNGVVLHWAVYGGKIYPMRLGQNSVYQNGEFLRRSISYYYNHLHCKSMPKHCFTLLLNTFGTQMYKLVITVRLHIV